VLKTRGEFSPGLPFGYTANPDKYEIELYRAIRLLVVCGRRPSKSDAGGDRKQKFNQPNDRSGPAFDAHSLHTFSEKQEAGAPGQQGLLCL
jgi:hypothetical protein